MNDKETALRRTGFAPVPPDDEPTPEGWEYWIRDSVGVEDYDRVDIDKERGEAVIVLRCKESAIATLLPTPLTTEEYATLEAALYALRKEGFLKLTEATKAILTRLSKGG